MIEPNNPVAEELLSKFKYYSSFRTPYEEKAIENYKLYVGSKEPKEAGMANLHIPKIYEIVDTIRARYVLAFFKNRPYFEFIPRGSDDPNMMAVNEYKARFASALLDLQLDKNAIPAKFYNYITDLCLYPAAILGVGWRYEMGKVKKRVYEPELALDPLSNMVYETGRLIDRVVESEEAIWDDNQVENIDFWDFWPDPTATSDFDTCRGAFHREWMTREELQNKLEFYKMLGEGQFYDVDLDKLQENTKEFQREGKWERLNAVGVSMESRDVYSQTERDKMKATFEVLHYWENDRHALLVNRSACVYDGPSPYWRHKRLPFIFQSFDPLTSEIYGQSAVGIIKDLQHELNSNRNAIQDNVNLIIHKVWLKRRGAILNEDQMVFSPGNVIDVDDIDRDLRPLEVGDVKASSFTMDALTVSQMESTVATPAIIRGVDGPAQTAAEAMTKSSNASTRFDVRIMLLDICGINRLALLMDMNNQQFINTERIVNLAPEGEYEWRTVQPYEIFGEFDYRPAGVSVDPAANKEVRRQQLTEMMTFLMSSGSPYIDPYELTKAWIESFDVRNPTKFLLPKEQVMQQQAMQQMMMAMLGGQVPSGGGGSGMQPGMPPINMAANALGTMKRGVM